MINREIKYKFAFAAIVVFFTFFLANIFLFPLLNSGDDFYLMYMLGGGYGLPPTNLLHYDHIWHPALGWFVKTLFIYFPGINWYAAFLIFLQGLGFTVIFYVFLRKFNWVTALAIYLLLFFFVEIRNLISVNFTASAWVMATAGMLFLLDELSRSCRRNKIILACLILVVASLLRIHVAVMVAVLFAPLFIIYAYQRIRTGLLALLLVAVIVFSLNQLHLQYYKKHIPDWEYQESVRQSLFYVANRPRDHLKPWDKIFRDSTELAFYQNRFYYDTAVFKPQRLLEIAKGITRFRNFDRDEDFQVFYWLFIGLRVYILLLAVCIAIIWKLGLLRKTLKLFAIPAATIVLVLIGLIIFLKITTPIYLGLILMLFLSLFFSLSPEKLHMRKWNRQDYLPFILLLAPLIWIGVRVWEDNSINKKNYMRHTCVLNELNANRDKLFVNLDNRLPFDYFFIWDTPSKSKVTNVIVGGSTPGRNLKATLNRYGVADEILALYENNNVFLVGEVQESLVHVFREKYNLDVRISQTNKDFRCLKVSNVISK